MVLKELLADARKKLASYMVPSAIFPVEDLPRLPGSMKVAKKLLEVPVSQMKVVDVDAQMALFSTLSPDEANVFAVFETCLGVGKFASKTDSFFDAGGHSLVVSRCVSLLRENYPWISARDVYANPTVQSLAGAINALKLLGADVSDSKVDAERKLRRVHLPWWRYLIADIFQFLSLYFLVLLGLFHAYGVLTFAIYLVAEYDTAAVVTLYMLMFFALLLYSILLSVGMKWLLIGKYKEGDYPLWGSYHMRCCPLPPPPPPSNSHVLAPFF